MMQGVGDKIRQLRKQNKDTLKGLAEKIDYDWSNLSKIERGIFSIPPEMLNKILKTYNVQPEDFFGKSSAVKSDNHSSVNFKFIVDGVETTEREVIEAIRLIRFFRLGND